MESRAQLGAGGYDQTRSVGDQPDAKDYPTSNGALFRRNMARMSSHADGFRLRLRYCLRLHTDSPSCPAPYISPPLACSMARSNFERGLVLC